MDLSRNFFRAYNNTIRMMKVRGYTLSDGNDLDTLKLNYDEFTTKFTGVNSNELDITNIQDKTGKPVYVKFNTSEDMSENKSAAKFIKLIEHIGSVYGITMDGDKCKTDTKKVACLLNAVKVIFIYNGRAQAKDGKIPNVQIKGAELIPVQKMTFCILDHKTLMPRKVTVLLPGSTQHTEIIKKYKNRELPQCTIDDPLARYFDAPIDSILELVRPNHQIAWRRVNGVKAHK